MMERNTIDSARMYVWTNHEIQPQVRNTFAFLSVRSIGNILDLGDTYEFGFSINVGCLDPSHSSEYGNDEAS